MVIKAVIESEIAVADERRKSRDFGRLALERAKGPEPSTFTLAR